jgi:hypothetical protein
MADPYDGVIQNVGKYAVPISLLLWGMAAARGRSLRQGANSSALRSLMLALGAWVVMLLEVGFAPMLPWQMSLGAVLIVVVLGLWASALGVGGLIQVRRARSGMLPAMSGIIIGLGLAGIMGWGTASGYFRGRQEPVQVAPRAELVDFGFSVAPPHGWEAVDPKKMNPNARLAYVRLKPTMALVIMAENAASGQSFEVPQVVDYVRSSLGTGNSSPLRQEQRSVAGRNGVLLGIDAAGPNQEFNYSVWLSASGSQAIIAMVSAKSAEATPAAVAAEASEVFGTIKFP